MNATLTDRPLSSTATSNGSPTHADTPSPAPPTRPRLPPFHLDVAATLALAAYSAVVAIGFARVFSGWSFARDLAILIAFGHGGSLLLRRLRVTGWVAVPAMLLASVWLLLARRYGATFRWLLPSGETWRLVDLQLDLVRAQFQTAVAPVVYDIGWALLAGVAIVLTVALADAFAFRAEARGEALVPGMVLFVFVAALGSPRLRVAVTAGMVGTGVLAVIALRARQDRRRRVALGTARQTTMIPVALVTAGIIAIFAGVVGPRLPGAGDEPLFETRGRGDRTTRVISPLVDIRSRLTNTSSIELFRVAADQPAYWRVTTLGDFDGQKFGLPTRRLERVTDLEPEPGARVVRQQVQVVALLGQLIPAVADPYQAAGKSAAGADMPALRQDRDTGSLLSPDELVSGDLFSIVSASPILDADRLRAAEAEPDVDGVYLGIPDDLPEVVGRLAGEVTAGAPTTYDQAMALQTWFRNEFTYSLEVQQGHSGAAIEAFLDIRVGYCEQFAATFAAMARTLGIPSRVAVGYTPGELTPDNWYSVRGKNAHAWPELYFQGVGWVAFEPTPGRGAPGAESYTRVPAQQDESAGAGAPGGTSSVTVAPPPTVPPRDLGEGDFDPVETIAPAQALPEEFDGVDAGRPTPTDVAPSDESDGVPWGWLAVYAIAGLLAALPWLIRRSYVHAAHRYAPAERVFAAWSRACRAAVCAGVHGADSMTVSQWASATATRLPVAARPMRELAQVVDAVGYGRPGFVDLNRVGSYGTTLGHDCDMWAAQVERVAVDELTTAQRLRRYFTDIRKPAKSASWV